MKGLPPFSFLRGDELTFANPICTIMQKDAHVFVAWINVA